MRPSASSALASAVSAPPVQLPCVAEVLGMHLLRSLLHCTALPVSRPRRLVACRARVHRLPIKEKTAHGQPVA